MEIKLTEPINSLSISTSTEEPRQTQTKGPLDELAQKTASCAQILLSRLPPSEEAHSSLTPRKISLDVGLALNQTTETKPVKNDTSKTKTEKEVTYVYGQWHHEYPSSKCSEAVLMNNTLNETM